MESRKNVIFFRILLSGLLIFGTPFFASAYGIQTHVLLTEEIIKFAHSSFPELTINQDEQTSIVKGTVEEDNGTRWLQHFFDPVHNRGLTLGGGGAVNPNLAFVGGAPIKAEWQSAKDWATNTGSQGGISNLFGGIVGNYFSASDDYSWDRAIYEYAWGNKARGLESLGHVLHLIEDSSVPDHTRNDPHPALGSQFAQEIPFLAKSEIIGYLGSHNISNTSPYESYVNFGPNSIPIADTLKSENKKTIILPSLSYYFDKLAIYSNKNFFSKDTIFSSDYVNPTVEDYTSIKLSNGLFATFGIKNVDGKQYKIVRADEDLSSNWQQIIKNNSNKNYFVSDDDDLILKDYWSLLSK